MNKTVTTKEQALDHWSLNRVKAEADILFLSKQIEKFQSELAIAQAAKRHAEENIKIWGAK